MTTTDYEEELIQPIIDTMTFQTAYFLILDKGWELQEEDVYLLR